MAADLEGLTCSDILRFPDLKAKYLIESPSLAEIKEAAKINIKLFEDLCRQHGANTRKVITPDDTADIKPISVSVVSVSTEDSVMASYKVSVHDLQELLVSLGYKLANKWPQKRLLETVRDKIAEHEEAEECSDPALLKKLIKAVSKGVEIVLEEGGDEEEDETPKKAPKASKKKPAPKDEEEDEEDEEEEDEESEEEEEAAPKAKGKKSKEPVTVPKKAPKAKVEETAKAKTKSKKAEVAKGPGVIATIVKIVEGATKTKPLTREDIFAKLVDAFPDRDAESMMATVKTQVPSRLTKDKGMTLEKNDKGAYWVVKS